MKPKPFACHQCRSQVLPESGEVASCLACGQKYRVSFKRLSVTAALPLIYVFFVVTFRTWQIFLGGLVVGVLVAYLFDKKGWRWVAAD